MRIIGGLCRGRPLFTPKGKDVRPTSDKVRLAIFNALFSRGAVEQGMVIDAFCGTGALGLEALSQGAEECLFCDVSRDSLALAKSNAENLGLSAQSRFKFSDATKLGTCPEGQRKATLVFLDPPYRKGLVSPTIEALKNGEWISPDALFVIETEKEWNEDLGGGEIVFDKLYGDTRVMFWTV